MANEHMFDTTNSQLKFLAVVWHRLCVGCRGLNECPATGEMVVYGAYKDLYGGA